MRSVFGLVAICAVVLGLLASLAVVVIVNPGNWFVKKSDTFDEELFLMIEPGSGVEEARRVLGPPVLIEEDLRAIHCEGCRIYYFMGDQPSWLIGHRTAAVVADSDGVVLSRSLIVEP